MFFRRDPMLCNVMSDVMLGTSQLWNYNDWCSVILYFLAAFIVQDQEFYRMNIYELVLTDSSLTHQRTLSLSVVIRLFASDYKVQTREHSDATNCSP